MTEKLTPEEYWDLNQGLWRMLGCDMELKHINKKTVVYVDNKTNKQYDYVSLGYIKENIDATKS